MSGWNLRIYISNKCLKPHFGNPWCKHGDTLSCPEELPETDFSRYWHGDIWLYKSSHRKIEFKAQTKHTLVNLSDTPQVTSQLAMELRVQHILKSGAFTLLALSLSGQPGLAQNLFIR